MLRICWRGVRVLRSAQVSEEHAVGPVSRPASCQHQSKGMPAQCFQETVHEVCCLLKTKHSLYSTCGCALHEGWRGAASLSGRLGLAPFTLPSSWLRACCLLLQGLDHVILVAAAEQRIHLRQYAVRLKKSGTRVSNTTA